MTRHPKPDLAAMSGAVFLALVAILTGLSIFAQCHHATAPRPDDGLPYIVYPDSATCQPWPQCDDPEPPPRPEKE